MTVNPAIALSVPNYANRTPYITVDDYLNAPTGTDTTQLLPGKGSAPNKLAVSGVIERASSAMDTYCQKVLAATVDTQAGSYRIQRDGTIKVPVDNTPLIMVTGVSYGWQPSSLVAMTDLSNLWLDHRTITIPALSGANPPYPMAYRNASWTSMFVNVSYVNGWYHSVVPLAVAKGATSLTPSDVVGAVPNLPFVIYDGENTETVQVAANYVPGAATLTLAAATTKDHQAGVTVSALPPDIRQAALLMTSAFIKKRGGEAIVLAAMQGGPQRKALGEPGMTSDMKLALDLLKPYRRVI